MQKKIIAVCLIVLSISLIFVSCGNKYLMGEVNGQEMPLVTDESGNTEVNFDGQIAVYVTDSKGNIKYDSDGNPQKNYYDLPDRIVNGQTLETHEYKFTMSDDWTLEDNGYFYKKGSDSKCYVYFVKAATLESYETMDMFVANQEANQNQYIEQFKTVYPDCSMQITAGNLADGKEVVYFTYSIKDNDGASLHYAVSAYVNIENDIYQASYICDGPDAYDETFDFVNAFATGFTVK